MRGKTDVFDVSAFDQTKYQPLTCTDYRNQSPLVPKPVGDVLADVMVLFIIIVAS